MLGARPNEGSAHEAGGSTDATNGVLCYRSRLLRDGGRASGAHSLAPSRTAAMRHKLLDGSAESQTTLHIIRM